MKNRATRKASGRPTLISNNYRQDALRTTFYIMDKEESKRKSMEEKEKRGKQLGPREKILEAYKVNCEIDDAIAVMNDINNKIGKQAYTKDMVKVWIQEYEDKNKSHEDDDDAR